MLDTKNIRFDEFNLVNPWMHYLVFFSVAY